MREVVHVVVAVAAIAAGCKKSEAPKQPTAEPAAAQNDSSPGTPVVAKQVPSSTKETSQEELTRLRDKRLGELAATDAPSEFTQENVPVGITVDDLKKRYRCKLQRSHGVEFGPLNFVPPFEEVFPIVGGFHMGFRQNGMEYQSLLPGIVTSSAQCDALKTKFYGVYWKKSDGTVIGIQKFIELKGAPQQIFDTAYESMRQKCTGRISRPFQGTWVVDRSKERFGGVCDEGALRTIVTTNPVTPLSAIITYVDLASWKSEIGQDARGVTNTKADVDKLAGRL